MLLSQTKRGQAVTVEELVCAVSKQRLLDLGIFKGTKIKVKGFAPLGDPMIIEVGDSEIALRKSDAKNILVEAGV